MVYLLTVKSFVVWGLQLMEEGSIHSFIAWNLHCKDKESSGFDAEIMPSQMKDGKKNVEFIVLKRGFTFSSNVCVVLKGITSLQNLQTQTRVHAVAEAVAEYLHQVTSGTKLGWQIIWWEGSSS